MIRDASRRRPIGRSRCTLCVNKITPVRSNDFKLGQPSPVRPRIRNIPLITVTPVVGISEIVRAVHGTAIGPAAEDDLMVANSSSDCQIGNLAVFVARVGCKGIALRIGITLVVITIPSSAVGIISAALRIAARNPAQNHARRDYSE